MRDSPKVELWVVYETVTGPTTGMRSICTTSEWRAAQSLQPGKNRLVKEGISDEGEAEKLARGTSGDAKERKKTPRPKFE